MKQVLLLLLLCCTPALAQTYYTTTVCGTPDPGCVFPLESGVNLISLTLPAGSYLINATPEFYTITADTALVGCYITGAGKRAIGGIQVTVESPYSVGIGNTELFGFAAPSVPGLVKLKNKSTVSLFCQTSQVAFTGSLYWSGVLMTATKTALVKQ